MALELTCFLAGSLIFLIPGIWLARSLSLGNNLLEQWTYGSSIGLALAVYLASVISNINLNWFYPLWGAVIIGSLAAWLANRKKSRAAGNSQIQIYLASLLFLVALIRFGIALGQTLPEGSFDPTFHLILARKIQLAHHAIYDWTPFESVKLNYPTGSHMLVVVLSGLARLPLHTVFKDLVPLLGVLSTAQVYVLACRVTGNVPATLFSAFAYGLWAWYGSNGYYRWGGLPNELAMLLFIAMLSLWLDHGPRPNRWAAMTVLFAATLLVHHHVMVTGGVIFAAALLWIWVKPRSAPAGFSGKIVVAAVAAALMLDSFFIIPYAAKIVTLSSTAVWHNGEKPLVLSIIPESLGYVLCVFAVGGIILYFCRRMTCHPLVVIASATLLILFCGCEFLYPAILAACHLPPATLFTPSRFLTDLNYFLPIFAGLAVAYLQQKWRIALGAVFLLMGAGTLFDFESWQKLAAPRELSPGFIDACAWIQNNTSPTTIVDNDEFWTTYLTWRRADITPLPDSEPVAEAYPQKRRIPLMMSYQIPLDAPDQKIVAITDKQPYTGQKILWQDKSSGLLVVQEWPPVP